MKTIKKIYCRTFQTAFKIAGPILPYKDPQIIYNVEETYKILENKTHKKPVLVTDKILSSTEAFKLLEQSLKNKGVNYILFDETVPNPTSYLVEKVVRIYNENNCDCFIAFGGGSPMDCAKAAAARIARPKRTLQQLSGLIRICKKLPTVIAIPTTAGTGSETTPTAVITDAKTRHKYTMNDFVLIPAHCVLDYRTTRSLPQHIAATTGVDALTHAVEAYIGRTTYKKTRKDCENAVKLIFGNIEKAVFEKEETALENMLIASHKAGRAFSRSYVGYIHAVSHSLSGKYNMPHGLTNAVIMPWVLEKYGNKVYNKLAKLALVAGIGNKGMPKDKLAKLFIEEIRKLNKKLGIPQKLEGIKAEDIPEMAKYADKEGNPLYPVPILWDAKELEQIYYDVMER